MVFPELVLAGYPPEDLVLKPAFQEEARRAVEALRGETADGGPALLVGAPWVDEGKLYNAVLLLRGGKVASARFKHDLPNYGVFDEKRVFAAGPMPGPMAFRAGSASRSGSAAWSARTCGPGCRRGPRGIRRRDPDRAQRLAVRGRQAGRAHEPRGRARDRDRAAADLLQPGRRTGRAGVRRRVVRAQRRSPSRRRRPGRSPEDC